MEPAGSAMGPRAGGYGARLVEKGQLSPWSLQRVLVVGNGTPLAALFAVSGFY